MKNSKLVFHPLFIGSLILLLLNDFYFKQQFGNDFTGKLSDFAGLIVFPVFVAIIFPKSEKWISLLTGILFILWKTPLATPFIDFFNTISFYTIQRTIDYSDYIALIVLPLAHKIITSSRTSKFQPDFYVKFGKVGILSFCFFAICATSKSSYNCVNPIPDGTVYIGKAYRIKSGEQAIIDSLQSMGFTPQNKTLECDWGRTSSVYHQIDSVPFLHKKDVYSHPARRDTIVNVNFQLFPINDRTTRMEIINVTLKYEKSQDWKDVKRLHKKYKKIVKQTVVNQMKK